MEEDNNDNVDVDNDIGNDAETGEEFKCRRGRPLWPNEEMPTSEELQGLTQLLNCQHSDLFLQFSLALDIKTDILQRLQDKTVILYCLLLKISVGTDPVF